MTPFLYSLLLFSPLLIIASSVLYLLDRLDSRRRPAPAPPEPPSDPTDPAVLPSPPAPTVEDYPANSDSEPESDTEQPAAGDEPAPARDPAAGDHTARAAPRTRNIGPKKARSIARRDQRRAYHEFIRSQRAEADAADAAVRAEEEARATENTRKRLVAEEKIAALKERERDERVKAERALKEREAKDVAAVVGALRGKRSVDLEKVAQKVGRGREWVEGVVKREGLLGVGSEGDVRMVTRAGVWVCIDKARTSDLWKVLEEKGRMDWSEMGEALEKLLKK